MPKSIPLTQWFAIRDGGSGGYYGRGPTKQAAMKACYRAGAREGRIVHVRQADESAYMDEMGGFHFARKVDHPDEPLTVSKEFVQRCFDEEEAEASA